MKLKKTKIVVVGGCKKGQENECLRSLEVLDLKKLEKAEDEIGFERFENVLQFARRGPALMAKNNSIFVAGGCSKPKKHLKSIEKIIFQNGDFRSILMDEEVEEASCTSFCQIDEKMLIVGGFDGFSCLNQCNFYDFEGQSEKFPAIICPLKNSVAIIDPTNQKQVLLIGGWDEKRTLKTIIGLNLETKTSEIIGMLPFPVEGHSATVMDSKIVIIGGFDGFSVIDKVVVLDGKNVVESETKLEIPRENHSTIFIPELNQLLIIGGWDGKQSLKSVERFKVKNDAILEFERLKTINLSDIRQKSGVILL